MHLRYLLLGLLLFSACAEGDGATDGLVLSIADGRYTPGDSVELVLSNGTGGAIGFNLCPSTLSVQVGGDWTPVPSDRICTMELRTLEAGDEARFNLELPLDISPGRYRVGTNVDHLDTDAPMEVSSNPFDVR